MILLLAMLALGAYLLGSIPFGLLVSRACGAPDPRTGGSGNLGATNVARMAGKPAGVITLLLDAAKGAAPTALALAWLQGVDAPVSGLAPLGAALTGLAAFCGHCWPVYLRFKGGKGVATALGVYLAISPPALLGVLAVFLLAAWRTRHVSVGSMAGCSSAPLWLLMTDAGWPVVTVAVVMALLVFWRHRANLVRLHRGEENTI